MPRSPGQLPNKLGSDHTHLKSEIIDDETREPADFDAGAAGVTVNDGSTEAVVEKINAPGADLSTPGEASGFGREVDSLLVDATALPPETRVLEVRPAENASDDYIRVLAAEGGGGDDPFVITGDGAGGVDNVALLSNNNMQIAAPNFSLGRDGTEFISVNAIAEFFEIVRLIGLPTADPVSAGQLWNDTGVLKVSAG